MQEHDGEGEPAPAHHARRPMNAFLIFCKRHRSVVRDKYPNLENRSITKILGEWWANLDKEEKACYTGLAKQYKDAFFSANPDFKWYKLPAPPLRTLASRPREPHDKPASASASPTRDLYPDTEYEKTNNNSTKVDFNKKPREAACEEPKPLAMFTPGKLADEAQMGGLSLLLDAKAAPATPNPYYSPPPPPLKLGTISHEYRSHILERKTISREDNIRELQNALSETSKVFKEDFDENQTRIYRHGVPSDMFTHQHVIDQVVDKQYHTDEYGYPRNWSDDEKSARGGRSCKGKRYQEFMAVGGLMVSKRIKRERDRERERTPDDTCNASCSWDGHSTRSEDSATTEDRKPASPEATPDARAEPKGDAIDTSDQDNNANKTFKAADFDLDAKIAALPSLSLEKFQQKKRENKRRKKTINLKPKALGASHSHSHGHAHAHIVNSVPAYGAEAAAAARRELAESWREQVIGSQKRKPRKVSITRFEAAASASGIGASASGIGASAGAGPGERPPVPPREFKVATEAPRAAALPLPQPLLARSLPPAADLMALATLAEVAANTSKMDALQPLQPPPYTLTAKASDDASTV